MFDIRKDLYCYIVSENLMPTLGDNTKVEKSPLFFWDFIKLKVGSRFRWSGKALETTSAAIV